MLITLFTFNTFLIITLLVIAVMIYLRRLLGKKLWTYQRLIYSITCIMGFAAFLIIHNYTRPSLDEDIFSNLDYHQLEHLGFEFKESLKLVDEEKATEAIFDEMQGKWQINKNKERPGYVMTVDQYPEPVYVYNERENAYRVENTILPLPIEDYVEIGQKTAAGKHQSFLKIKITNSLTSSNPTYSVQLGNAPERQLTFSRFFQGYPVIDLIEKAKVQTVNNEDSLLTLLDGSLLLRNQIPIKKGKNNSPLQFFPTQQLLAIKGLYISNGKDTLNKVRQRHKISIGENTPFYNGFPVSDFNKMTLESTKGNYHHLRYLFPKRFALREKSSNNLFLCSSFEDVVQQASLGGYYFPILQDPKNKNHINANIRYYKGSANEQFVYKVNDKQSIKSDSLYYANQPFKLSTGSGSQNKLRWIFQINDFYGSNPLQPAYLYYFVVVYLLLFLLVYYLIGPKQFTTIEAVIYLLIFAFLLIRIILIWRMGTFPPTEAVKLAEFNFLRDFKHFRNTCIITLLFFIGRIIWGKWEWVQDRYYYLSGSRLFHGITNAIDRLWQNIYHKIDTFLLFPFKEGNFKQFIGIYLGLHAVGFLIGRLFLSERFTNIAIPVFIFFMAAYINAQRKNVYEQDTFNINPFRAFNTLFTLAWLGLWDTGYSIIFLLFLFLYELFRNLIGYTTRNNRRQKRRSLIAAVLLSIFFLIFIFAGIPLFKNALDTPLLTYIIGSIFGIITTLFFLYAIIEETDQLLPHKNKILAGTAGVLIVGSIAFSGLGQSIVERFSHVKYRAAIINEHLDEVIRDKAMDSRDVTLAFRAAQNQWFINTYLSDTVKFSQKSFRDHLRYFNIKPHFNKGSSYITQTTDLVVTRYIISEHSRWVILGLLTLLIAVCIAYAFTNNLRDPVAFTSFGICLLLFMMAFFIWLTSTNRFIFFGQDFPLISLTSNLTLIFTLGLWLVVIIQTSRYSKMPQLHPLMFLPFLLLLITAIILIVQRPVIEQKNFQINDLMTELKTDFEQLNDLFLQVQNDYKKQKKSRYIKDKDIKPLLGELTADPGLSEDSIPKVLQTDFAKSAFERFLKEQKNKQDVEEIVHLVKRGGYYRFAVNQNYYLVKPPQYYQNRWEGNVRAATTSSELALRSINSRSKVIPIPSKLDPHLLSDQKNIPKNLRLMVFPADWVKENAPVVVAATYDAFPEEQGKLTIQSNEFQDYAPYTQAFSDVAIRLKPGDYISTKYRRIKNRPMEFKLASDADHYFMQNIWLNGKQKYFYPLGGSFIWAYHYANAVNNVANRGTKDVSISLDYELTQNLHSTISKRAKEQKWIKPKLRNPEEYRQFAATVVDGAGRIRAIVDYKPQVKIDPNDIEELNEYNRNFYLNRQIGSERDLFGNRNLLRMQPGPGSSIKPIMYAAVTSQVNLRWDSLRMAGVDKNLLSSELFSKEGDLVQYGGRELGGYEWELLPKEFGSNTLSQYLIHSRNIYHSVVMFLGSYDRKSLKNNLFSGKQILKKATNKDFPRIKYPKKSGTYAFNPDYWPPTDQSSKTEDYFGNYQSVLAEGLESNFQLATYRKRADYKQQYENIDGADGLQIFDHCTPSLRNYCYPENAHFFQSHRRATSKGPFTRGIVMSTLGGSPIEVSPLKMAEMYGKLVSLNNQFEAHLNPEVPKKQKRNFSTEDWRNFNDIHTFYKNNLFKPLNGVISQFGTAAAGLNTFVQGRKYHYYAKTGTIANKEDQRGGINDKLLALIISKNDLTSLKDEAAIADNSFYVIYFYDHLAGKHVDWELIKTLIEDVESSELFKVYMD